MIKLKIIDKKDYEYKLKDESGKIYNLNLEFLDIENEINIGNYIYMNSKLLNSKYDGYSTSYTFGDLTSKYGKKDIELNDIDIIKMVIEDNEIYLKRLYG